MHGHGFFLLKVINQATAYQQAIVHAFKGLTVVGKFRQTAPCADDDLDTTFLHSAITPNPSGLGTHIPGLSEITKQSIIQKLKDKYGIEAHIDIGWLGLGIASENNTYKDIKTGKSLTHSEVMKRLGK